MTQDGRTSKGYRIKARYGAACAACGERIERGSIIIYDPLGEPKRKVHHTHCWDGGVDYSADARTSATEMRDKATDHDVGQAILDTPANGKWLDGLADAIAPRIEEKIKPGVDHAEVRKIVAEALADAPTKVTIHIPERDATYNVEGEHEAFPLLLQLIGLGEKVYAAGPAGSGKTTGCFHAADTLGMRRFLVTPCANEFQLLGHPDVNGNYVPTEFYKWATCEEPALLIIDEADRFLPRAVLALNSALANRVAVFPVVGEVTIPEHHAVVCTANTWGLGSGAGDYVGAMKQDAAFLNRFTASIDWGYDAKLERHMCRQAGGNMDALEQAIKIRANLKTHGIRLVWGPRDTVAVAHRVAAGMTLREALNVSGLHRIDQQERDRVLEGIL